MMKHLATVLIYILSINFVQGQATSFGNIFIGPGAEMHVPTGNFSIQNGGSGTLPGILGTERTAPRGYISFSSTSVPTNVSDAAFVDGYVLARGVSNFTFPIGDNGVYRPVAILSSGGSIGDDVFAAYYAADPGTAITSSLKGGNEPVLPAGGPFNTSQFNAAVLGDISNVEYWHIAGATNAPYNITLTWNAASGVDGMQSAALDKVTVVGWNPATSQWEMVPSTVDPTALQGGTSSLSSGSITTTDPTAAATYDVLSIGMKFVPLPVTLISFTGKPMTEGNKLDWSTSSEKNFHQFLIEKSINPKLAFTTIDSVAGGIGKYSFTDPLSSNGNTYYRLKMVDIDGSFTYSQIVAVYQPYGIDEHVAFPNPVTGRSFYMYRYFDIGSYRLTDLNGKPADIKMTSEANKYVFSISKNALPGIYIFEYEALGQTFKTKLSVE